MFHPFDTITKRLQSGQSLKNHASLYQGMGMAGVLKLTHRMIKYGGESAIRESLCIQFPKINPVNLRLMSGGMIGGIEALITTPLDTLKAKKQSGQYQTTRYLNLLMAEKSHLKPVPITFLRNSIGSAAFFGADSALRHYLYQTSDNDTLTSTQKIISSAVCPSVGTFVSYPADLLKTKIQINPDLPSAYSLFKTIIKNEGAKGLFKGISIKLITTFPSAMVSYFLFQVIRDHLQDQYNDSSIVRLKNSR